MGCSSTTVAPNQALSGTNAHYVKWQWNVVATSGTVWLRKLANANAVPGWVSYPQVDLSQPIRFDILLATNISVSVAVLLVVLYVPDALGVATFPTLLLITTLFRLALNVSSTRLARASGPPPFPPQP